MSKTSLWHLSLSAVLAGLTVLTILTGARPILASLGTTAMVISLGFFAHSITVKK